MEKLFSLLDYHGCKDAIPFILGTNGSVYKPYHGFRHNKNVALASFELGHTYQLPDENLKALLLGGLFHDYGHSGSIPDRHNIDNAINGFIQYSNYNGKIEVPCFRLVEDNIRATIFDKVDLEEFSMDQKIMRDADMCAINELTFFEDIISGYMMGEMGYGFKDALEKEIVFLEDLKWCTDAAAKIFDIPRQERLAFIKFLNEQY